MSDDSSKNDESVLDELTFTLKEFNKAMGNIQYMAGTIKELDLASLLKGKSGSRLLKLLKNIDLEQVSSVLQSPLVQQILSDPEFLSLFLPEANQSTQNESQQPYYGRHQNSLPPANPFGSSPPNDQRQQRAAPYSNENLANPSPYNRG